MKSELVLASVLAVAAGAVSAAVTTLVLLGGRFVAAPPVEASVPAVVPGRVERLDPQRENSELVARLEELRELQHALGERLADLEARPVDERQPVTEGVSRVEFEAFRDEVRAHLSGEGGSAAPFVPEELLEAPEWKSSVSEALQAIRRDEAIAKAWRNQEKQAARLEERVTNWSEWLELDEFQSNELRAILADQDERHRGLIKSWEQGMDDETLGETKRILRAEVIESVRGVLNPQQWETFHQKVEGGDGGK